MPIETRALPGAAVTDINPRDHTVTARVLVYDRADSYGSVWRPGVMADSLRASKPVICAHHDLSRPIARVADFDDSDTALDLHLVMADLDAVPDARTAFSLMESKIIDGWSVGFVRNVWDPVPKEQRSAYGEHEAKEYMVKCGLREASLVSLPSVPGVGTLAIRAEETPALTVITIEDIERQFKDDLLDRHEARALLAALSPEYRLHIVLNNAAPVVPIPEARTEPEPPEPAEAAEMAVEPAEGRATMTLSDGDATPASGDGYDDDGDVADLAAAVDAALDSAAEWIAKVDTSSLPDELKQALALVAAAGAVADELLDALGVPDVDEPGDDSGRSVEDPEVTSEAEGAAEEAREVVPVEVEERTLTLSTKPWDPKQGDYTPQQWKAACLIWDGPDDSKSSGSLPVKEPDGTVNKAALSAAAGRLSQVDAPDDVKKAAAKALMSLYGQAKMKFPPSLLSAARTIDDDPETRAIVADAVDSELDDLFGRLGVEAA